MGSGTLLAAEWRVTFANWQHLTWMLTHAQHQLSIWPWPAAGAVAAAAAAENRWPIEAPTSRQFPHFPAHTSMGTCAALRCVIEIRPSSKSVWVHSSIHSLSHTHTHSYSDTLARDVDLAFAAAAAALETQITITWNAFQSAAESVAYSSAPTARQLSPQPFLPVFFLLSHSTHAGLPAKSYWEMFLFKLCVIRMDKLSANQTEKRTKLPFCFALFVFCASIFEHFHRQQPDTHKHTHIHAATHMRIQMGINNWGDFHGYLTFK